MRLLQLWGKTAAERSYHPALFHLLDVGHVAQALLAEPASPRLRRVLAAALGVDDPDALRAWLPLVCALHDVGKISAPFQAQVPEQRERLAALGFTFMDGNARYPHQHISAVEVDRLVEAVPVLAPLRWLLRDVYAGHHGQFVGARTLRPVATAIQELEPAGWASLRREALDVVVDVFGLPTAIEADLPNLRAAAAVLTGFLILCDWLGSDEHAFPPSPDLSLDEYVPLSRERAERAVADAGFLRGDTPPVWAGFRSTFPNIAHPRPLQSAIDDLSPRAIAWPGLYIIEAPTGEGKTEAALALARRLAAEGWSDELYVAMPTTATSDQMFGRVLRFLNADRPAPVKLIHGQAFLSEDALRMRAFGDHADPESPAFAAPTWFAPKKRALLAPYGVGTVDQAELSVLSARHYVLRLFGLAGKVVIIDEVHAYDTYMSTVIEHALRWFAALGTPVILLSATLPQARHRQLAQAYLAGLPDPATQVPLDAMEECLPYPALSAYTAAGIERLSPPAAQPDRALRIAFVPDLTPLEEAQRLLRRVVAGGAVARLTNTVGRAQAIYAALRQVAPPTVELHLLHARMPGEDRLAREARLAERLGPGSKRGLGDRIVVVGTQVLEQSLDYDVDLMITDLAPTDLLLQRAGRLQRHDRVRPEAFCTPLLQVAMGFDSAGAPEFGPSAFVYEPFILWKSWLTLRGRQTADGGITLSLPADYRPLIEATYDDRRDIVPDDDPVRAALEAAWRDYCREQQKMQDKARQRLIPDPDPARRISEEVALYFEEDEDGGTKGWGSAATRYGLESISLIPLHRVPGGIALEPGGTPLTAVEGERDCQLQLVRRAIRVSHPVLVREIPRRQDPSLGWFGRIPLLRGYHPLVLDDGWAEIGGVAVRLDPDLGLVIGGEDVHD